MIYTFKDADGNAIGDYNVGRDTPPEYYVGQLINDIVVSSVEVTSQEDLLTDRELTEKKDEELRILIEDLTARVEALENR